MTGWPPFGAWLKARRKALDLRQEDLAFRVGCSFKTIEKIESGERRPSRQVAELLAAGACDGAVDAAGPQAATIMAAATQITASRLMDELML